MRTVFAIREKNTGTWCDSAKHRAFANSFDAASLFMNEDNAKRAIKQITRGLYPKNSGWPAWSLNGGTVVGTQEGLEEFQSRCDRRPDAGWVVPRFIVPDFEVVEFELVERK